MTTHPAFLRCAVTVACLSIISAAFADPAEWETPVLPNGQARVVSSSPSLVQKPFFMDKLQGLTIAKHAPTVIFSFLPGQDHAPGPGRCWSYWGRGIPIGGKYYTAFGDHHLTTYVVEWNPETGEGRILADMRKVLNLPEDQYTPGKIHSQLTLGKDGWIYYSTHNGGANTLKKFVYNGDWIFRTHPETGKTEIVAQAPAGPASIPNGFADPERMIFFGGTEQESLFFAYDLANRKLLYTSPVGEGPQRCMPYASSTGRIYYRGNWQDPWRKRMDDIVPKADARGRVEPEHPWGIMRRWDAATGEVVEIATECNPRAASRESKNGIVWIADYTGKLWKLDVKKETFTPAGNLAPLSQTYITSLSMDSTDRYLYYVPGAHGTAQIDGTPVLQYDTVTNKVKAICFMAPATLLMGTGFICNGTFGMTLSDDDSTLYVTWSGYRPDLPHRTTWSSWDVCAASAIRIPVEERTPPVKGKQSVR